MASKEMRLLYIRILYILLSVSVCHSLEDKIQGKLILFHLLGIFQLFKSRTIVRSHANRTPSSRWVFTQYCVDD